MLWHKMHEIDSQGKQTVVALESLGLSEEHARERENALAKQAYLFDEVPRKPYSLQELEAILADTAIQDSKSPDKLGHKMDSLGLEMIAQIFNRRISYVEAHDKKGVLGHPPTFHLPPGPMPLDEYFGHLREDYKDFTGYNIRRHQVVAENLAKLVKEHAGLEDGNIVIFFGFEHAGMEEHIRRHLQTNNITFQIERVVKSGVAINGWNDLVSKKYSDPLFTPTDEELARAHLNQLVTEAICSQAMEGLAKKQGAIVNKSNTNHFRYMASQEREFGQSSKTARRYIEKMDYAQIRRHIEQYLTSEMTSSQVA